MRKSTLIVVTVLTVVLATLACNAPATQTPTTPIPPTTEGLPSTEAVSPTETGPTTATPTPPPNVRGPGFATYSEILVKLPAVYSGYTLPLDVDGLGNVRQFSFSDVQRSRLAQNGFVVAPAEWLEFYQLYEHLRYEELPIFITTDSVYHIYHLIFDKMLRDLEREHFEPDIRALTAACLQSAQNLYGELRGTELEDNARRVVAYFAVADALINPSAVTPPEAADLVAGELALIEAHGGMGPSAIFNEGCPANCDPCDLNPPPECLDQPCMCEDYSQYVPRGHYTRSEQLQRYFRAMMWYGRINMRLQNPNETRMALLITYILRHTDVNGQPAVDVWARVYDPTVFIVGKSDDLGIYEYGALWDSVFGPDASAAAIADEPLFARFVAAARQLPPPPTNSMWAYLWEDDVQATTAVRSL
jgi:hypothetical protein